MLMNQTECGHDVVAGGAGFLGSHLCHRLLKMGRRVTCLDNFQTGSFRNIEDLANNRKFAVVDHDVIDEVSVNEHVDCVYNLACPASPPRYQADPVKTVRACVTGTYNLLELARRHGARFLLASTSEVYGDPAVHPQKESYRGNVNPVGLRSCYDEGKRCAEALSLDYGRCNGINVKIARIFNTYGPRMAEDDGRVVSNFIMQALQGHGLTIYGNGLQTRSLCYVDDMVEGLLSLMNSADDFHGPVNLGNPHEITILQLAETIQRLCGTQCALVFHELPSDDPTQRRPDIRLAQRQFGWEPLMSLEQGLGRTIDYFSGRLAGSRKARPNLAAAPLSPRPAEFTVACKNVGPNPSFMK